MSVKQEVKQEARFESAVADDGETELDFSQANDKIWLVKLPKFLFDKWVTASPGTELGHLKMNEANRKEMKVVLSDGLTEDSKTNSTSESGPSDIPLEYSLEMQNQSVTNTYIFSEPAARSWADRPSRAGTPVEGDAGALEMVTPGEAQPEKRRSGGGPDRSRKNLGGQRLGGKIVHDCLVKPIDNQLYRSLLRDRVSAADVPKRRVQSFDDVALSGNLMAPGSIKSSRTGAVKTFITSKPGARRGRDINARMSLDNLLDEIVNCFKQYEYWSLKAFKAHLKQPESYLKETLENIATLHKRGPMTGKWQLKAETRNAMKGYAGLSQFDKTNAAAAAAAAAASSSNNAGEDDQKIKSEHEGQAAPEVEGEEEDDDGDEMDDSDEDVEMEDKL